MVPPVTEFNIEVKVACTSVIISPAITDVPPVLVTVLGPVAAVIALIWMLLIVIVSKTPVPLPPIVSVIVVASVRATLTDVISVPVKEALPAEVNSKLAGVERISVPNVEISVAKFSLITILPSVKEGDGNEQVVNVNVGAVIVTCAKAEFKQANTIKMIAFNFILDAKFLKKLALLLG